jgi:flagellar hook-length control protein FliK
VSQAPAQPAPAVQGQQPAAPVAAGPIQLAPTAPATAVAGEAQNVQGAGVPAQPGDAPVLPGTPAGAPVVNAPAAPAAQKPVQDAPVATQQPVVDPKQTTSQQAPAAPAQPKAPTHATAAPTQQDPSQQNAGQQQPQNAPAPAPAPTPEAATAPQPQQVPTNPQSPITNLAPAQPVTQASAPSAPSAPPAPPPGARLQQAVETVQQVIKISQSSGITQARVQLHPEELGSIDIHLRSTPDGVVARVVADASQAAAVLRDGGDELRRQLASQGINLTHFDVGTTGQEQRGTSFGNQGQGQHGHGGNGNTPEDVESGASLDNSEETTIALPNGVLVDVLA